MKGGIWSKPMNNEPIKVSLCVTFSPEYLCNNKIRTLTQNKNGWIIDWMFQPNKSDLYKLQSIRPMSLSDPWDNTYLDY